MQNQTHPIISTLVDLASEIDWISDVVDAIGGSDQIGLAIIIGRWAKTLVQLTEELEPEVSARVGHSYYISPPSRAAIGPFAWMAVDNASARVVAHGVAEDWSAADAAAIAAIAEMEASA